MVKYQPDERDTMKSERKQHCDMYTVAVDASLGMNVTCDILSRELTGISQVKSEEANWSRRAPEYAFY